MTKEEKRVIVAVASIRAHTKQTNDVCDRLEAAIDASDGVPVRALSEDDSLAVAVDDARKEQEEIMKTERSRRAARLSAR